MPFCTNCGKQAGAADVFCSGCGARQAPEPAGFTTGASSRGTTPPDPSATGAAPETETGDARSWKRHHRAGGPWGPNGPRDFAADMNPRAIAALCYVPIFGWIASLYVLAGERFRNDMTVRFHAFQGLYLFVGWLILDWGVGPLLNGWWRVAGILKAGISIVGIIMLVKTLRNQDERLPFVGDLADRSVREQR